MCTRPASVPTASDGESVTMDRSVRPVREAAKSLHGGKSQFLGFRAGAPAGFPDEPAMVEDTFLIAAAATPSGTLVEEPGQCIED